MSEDTQPTADTPETVDVVVEVIDEGPCRKRLKVEVASERVSDELDSNYQQLRNTVQIPGFRKGKVPLSILKGRFGSKIEADVQEEMISSTFFDEIEKRELKVLGQPSFENIEFAAGDPLTYEASVEVAPEFELPNYKGLEVDAELFGVEASEIQSEVDALLERHGTLEPIATGDQKNDDLAACNVELVDEDGNTVFERSEVYLKIGLDRVDNMDVPGLGEKLLSAKADESFEFTLEAPDDFPLEDLRGKSTTLKVVFLEAKRMVIPSIDDELLEKLGAESEEALRSEIEKSLEMRRRLTEENRQEELLVEQVVSSVEFDFPPSILERRQEEVAMGRRFRMMREGKSQEEVEAEMAGTEEEIAEAARKELKQIFVLDGIAEKEMVLVTEDEIAKRITAIAMSSQRDPQEVFEEYSKGGMLEELRGGMRREKAREVIRKKAKVNKPDGAEEADSSEPEGKEE